MSDEWHYTIGGKQAGPISAAQLKQLASQGRLSRTDLVWKQGLSSWVQAGKLKGLFVAPAPAQPPPLPSASTFGVSVAEEQKPPRIGEPLTNRESGAVAQVRPWVRYWARMLDIYLAAILGGIVIAIVSPDALNEKGSDQAFGIVLIFAWVFIESLLLSTVGTTPGKWLFKIRLVAPTGGLPSYSTALSRSFKVWWRGLGIGFPLASLITLIVAHSNLTKNGVTTWDRDDSFTVIHDRIGVLRVIVAVVFFACFSVLVVIGSVANA